MADAKPSTPPPFRIGDFVFDPADGTLRSRAGSTRLEPKVQAVLLLLAATPGGVVSQDTLFREAWPDTHVAPGALARAISMLRDALGDDARAARYIETVPKRGYRLIAPIAPAPAAETATTAAPAETELVHAGYRARIALLAVMLAIAIAPHRELTPASSGKGVFAHGFRHTTRIGNETAYEHYARALERNPASPDAHAGLAAVHVFRANYLPDRERWVAAAIESAQRAVELDPLNVAANQAIAMAHAQAGRMQEAARHYRRALALHPADGNTRTNLGRALLATGRVADALTLFEQHAAMEPGRAAGYAHLAAGLAVAGYPEESAAAARAALAIEPYDLNAHLALVRVDLMSARYDAAEDRLTRLLQGYTDCFQCVTQLGLIDQLNARLDAAAARYRAALDMAPRFAAASLRLAQVLRATGQPVEADALVNEVERMSLHSIASGSDFYGPHWQLAAAAAIRGDRAGMLERYRQAVAAGRRDIAWDRWDPLFAPFLSDEKFRDLQAPADAEHLAARPSAQRVSRGAAHSR